MIFLGIDLGSSSIKASLFDAATGRVLAGRQHPDTEQRIDAPQPGWAEQDPGMWWSHVKSALSKAIDTAGITPGDIRGIGISYQMHGLVTLDRQGRPVRPAIIWCDSRAVQTGQVAAEALGGAYCRSHLLNDPGNFTASKLGWVMQQEPETYAKVAHWMLPGDYIAYRLTGRITTTQTGLSEGIFWDFTHREISEELISRFGFDRSLFPGIVPAIGLQGTVCGEAAAELGLRPDTQVSYRCGDQPNNAFSLNVLRPGEVAATAGTSGVIYAVTDKNLADPQSRINTFLHVTDTRDNPRNGVLICINGTGILYSWMRQLLGTGGGVTYEQMNRLAASAGPGSDGLRFYPFGNGAERVLNNRVVQAHIRQLDFHLHKAPQLLRAGMEGIIYALMLGFGILHELEYTPRTIRAGHANMFRSSLFRTMFTAITRTPLELYDTDGAAGAARGAALGYGYYANEEEAFASLERIGLIEPDPELSDLYAGLYEAWKHDLPEGAV